MFIVDRVVAGLNSSELINDVFIIIATCVSLTKRFIYLDMMMSIDQFDIVFDLLIDEALIQYIIWRWCFYINLFIEEVIVVLLLLIKIFDRIVQHKSISLFIILRERLDLLKFAIFVSVAIQILLALQWDETKYRWNSFTMIELFCEAIDIICCFLVWKYKKNDVVMIFFFMMRKRIVWCNCLMNFFFMNDMLFMSFYFSIYFQIVKNVSSIMSEVYLFFSILSQMFMARIFEWSNKSISEFDCWKSSIAISSEIKMIYSWQSTWSTITFHDLYWVLLWLQLNTIFCLFSYSIRLRVTE